MDTKIYNTCCFTMLICEGMRTDTHSSETKQIITRLQNFLFLNFTHIPLHNFAELSRSLSDPPDQKKHTSKTIKFKTLQKELERDQ